MKKKKSNIIIWIIVVAGILVIGVTFFFLLKSPNNCDTFIETYDKSKCECQKQFSTEYVNNLNTELGKLSNVEKLIEDQEKKMEKNGLNKEGCPTNRPYRSRLSRDKSDNYNVCYKYKKCSINPDFYKNGFGTFCQTYSTSKLTTGPTKYYSIPNNEVQTWEKQIKYYNLKDKIEEVKNNKVFSQGCDNFLSDPNTLLKTKSKSNIKNKFEKIRKLLRKINLISKIIYNSFESSKPNPIVKKFDEFTDFLYYNVIYYYYRYDELKDNDACKCNQTKYIQNLSQSIDFTKATQNPKKDELNINICKTKGKCFDNIVYGFEDKKAKSTHGRTKILGDPENLIKIFKKMGVQLYKDTVTNKEEQLGGNTKTYKKVLEDNGFNTIIEKMQNIWNQCRVLLGITGYCFVKKTCDSKSTVNISKKFGSGDSEINKYILCQNIPK